MNNPQIKRVINNIINDQNFINTLDFSIQNVFEDNKISSEDIPIIINVIFIVLNKYQNIRIDKKNINIFVKNLIIELLKNYNERNKKKLDINFEEFSILIDPYINLLVMNLNINKLCNSHRL